MSSLRRGTNSGPAAGLNRQGWIRESKGQHLDPAQNGFLSRPLNLIWRRKIIDSVLESYFIKEVLLATLGRPIRTIAFEDNAPPPLMNDALIVSFNTELANYIRAARAQGCRNIGIFHMADERGEDDRGFYAEADYVLRHYWFEKTLARPNDRSLGVAWVPNGFRNGVGPISAQTMLRMGDRTIKGFFAGMVEGHFTAGERKAMVHAIESAKLPFIVVKTPAFGQGLGPVSYAAYLSSARFAPIPAGNSPETIRLYDALEAGAIPIMLRSPYVAAPDALGNPPFILLDSWSELPAAYAPYAGADTPAAIERLEAKQREIVDWWKGFKLRQQQKVKELIDRSFARS